MQSNNDYKKELSFNLSTNKLTLALSALFVMIILGTIFLLNSKSVAGNSPTVSPTPALGLSTSGNTPQSQTGVAGASTTREQYGPQEPTSYVSIIPKFSPSPQKLSPTTSTGSGPTLIQSEPTATSVPTHSPTPTPTPTPTQTMIPTLTPTSNPSPILTPTKMPDDTPTLIPTGL